jgi:hypothetical protein
MALTYPLSLPSAWKVRQATIKMITAVGVSQSPFTFSQQTYVHQGNAWALDVQLVPMRLADAENCVALLAALNGREGTVLIPPPGNSGGVRGTWAGSGQVAGSHAAGLKSIAMDGFNPFATMRAGDWFSTGSGSTTHLYKVVQDATADSNGTVTLEIWPRLRTTLADNDTLTISAPNGIWRLANNENSYNLDLAQIYGLTAAFIEAL